MDEKLSVPLAQQKRSNLMQMARTFGRLFDIAAQMIIGAWTVIRRSITVLLILGLLATNVASIAIGSFQELLSKGYETVTDLASANRKLHSKMAATEKRLAAETARNTRMLTTVRKQNVALWNATAALHKSRQVMTLQGRKVTELAARSRQVRQIAQRVSRRALKSAFLNIESVLPQAVPVAGVAMVVAVTTVGLKMDCDTMKDMQGLEMLLEPEAQQVTSEPLVCGTKIPTAEELWTKVSSVPSWAKSTTKDTINLVKAYMPNVPDFDVRELKLPW